MANTKDSYWFKHDSTSGRGLRLKKIQHIYGHWGKGVYWDIIEVLREQSGYRFENSPMGLYLLAGLIDVKDHEQFNKFFDKCVEFSLFKIKNGFFYSEILIKNMKKWESTKANGSKGGRPKKGKEKNPNESELKSQSKAKRNHKIREEDIIGYNKREDYIKGNFFRINDVPYLTKLSKFIPEAFPVFYDQWLSKNNLDFLPAVLDKLDTDYVGYTFNDHNHIQNTFKKVWEKVEKETRNDHRYDSKPSKVDLVLSVNEIQENELKAKYAKK